MGASPGEGQNCPMNSMAARTAAAPQQLAHPVVRPMPRPPAAVPGGSTIW
jgi:hypothetical protein